MRMKKKDIILVFPKTLRGTVFTVPLLRQLGLLQKLSTRSLATCPREARH